MSFAIFAVRWFSVAFLISQPVSIPMPDAWTCNYPAAVASARQMKLPLLVVLEDCCEKNNRLFQIESPEGMEALRRFCVCRLNVNTPEGKRIADAYRATEFPYTLITDVGCKNIVFRGVGNFSQESWRTTLALHAGPGASGPEGAASPSTPAVKTDSSQKPVASKPSGEPGSNANVDRESTNQVAFTQSDVEAALRRSHRSDKPVVAYITMDGCQYCELMRSRTLVNDEVQAIVARDFESVLLHREAELNWTAQHNIRIYPTTLVIDSAGAVVDRIEGYVPPNAFLNRLRHIGSTKLGAVY